MNSVHADIILLSETNLQWQDYQIYQKTNTIRKNVFQFSRQITSSSSIQYDTTYQPGGTCSILVNKMVGRHHSSFADKPMGRWTVTNLTLPQGRILSVICCSQVCNQNIKTVGPKTAFSQQWTLLREQGNIRPNPRKSFIQDLDKLISSLTANNNSIILAGDFNTMVSDDITGLQRIITKFSLADCVQHLHGNYTCSTYSRGSKCLDYIFASRTILPAITQAGIPQLGTIVDSDHRPVFLDLNMTKCFGQDISCLVSPPNRSLFSSSPTKCEQYTTRLHSLMNNHNIFSRIERLSTIDTTTDRPQAVELAEAIDRDVTRLMLAAEKSIKRPSPTPFSSKLSQACIKVSLLKCQLSVIQYKHDKQESISLLQSRLHEPIQLPQTLNHLQTTLKKTRKEVRTIRKNSIAFRDDHLQALSLDQDIAKIIKQIRKIETLKRSFLKIKYIIHSDQQSLVTHIEVPSDDTPPKQATSWTQITDPDEITQRLIDRNTKHFGAAQGTPWTIPPLSNDYSWDTTTPAHQNTLAGNPPVYLDELTNKLLEHLKQRTVPTEPTITLTELIK